MQAALNWKRKILTVQNAAIDIGQWAFLHGKCTSEFANESLYFSIQLKNIEIIFMHFQ